MPGVCAMSPMFTVCHEERSTIRGGDFVCDNTGRAQAPNAARAATNERRDRHRRSCGLTVMLPAYQTLYGSVGFGSAGFSSTADAAGAGSGGPLM